MTPEQSAQPDAWVNEAMELANACERAYDGWLCYSGESDAYDDFLRSRLDKARDELRSHLLARPPAGQEPVSLTASEYLAKVEADPRRAAALERSRVRAGLASPPSHIEAMREARDALKPFANYACKPPCDCHNCKARTVMAKLDAAIGGAK